MRRNLIIAISLTLVLLLIPFKSAEAPEWEVKVVDESNGPMSGVTVRETYQNHSAESVGGERDLVTDERGKVVFPKVTLRASILKRITVAASSLGAGVHASFGPHATVFAFGKCEGDSVKDGYVEDWTGHALHNRSTIVCREAKGN